MTAFATTYDLSTLLCRPFDTAEEAQAALLLDMATAVIKSWTRQDIVLVENDTVKLPGVWSSDIELPQLPVRAIHSVSVNGIALSNPEWTWNERTLIRRGMGERAFDYPPGAFLADQDVIDWPLQQSGLWHWCGPAATVEVTYDHGYATVPADVHAICLSIAARTFVNPAGAVSERIGAYEITHDQTARGRSAGMVLTQEDQQALRKYRKWWG